MLDELYKKQNRVSRAITPENFCGEKGKGGMATEGTGAPFAKKLGGRPWKISPSIVIKSGETITMAEINGSGVIRHIWLTNLHVNLRRFIIRIYYNNSKTPSVEVPMGDFFATGLKTSKLVNSATVVVNPKCGFNSYWTMPFEKNIKITVENRSESDTFLYYQVDYTLEAFTEKPLYFHAYFNRVNPVPYKENFTILPKVKGHGIYAGTYMTWGVNSSGWWGEGEVKMYIDGDKDYPTICGTGTEDYFLGSYNFEVPDKEEYQEFSTLYSGMPVVERPDGVYKSQTRFSMYRWHILDPIYFDKDLRVTIQALGWTHWDEIEFRSYKALQDDLSAVAYYYKDFNPKDKMPKLQHEDYLDLD